jgi:hypothetical protein
MLSEKFRPDSVVLAEDPDDILSVELEDDESFQKTKLELFKYPLKA